MKTNETKTDTTKTDAHVGAPLRGRPENENDGGRSKTDKYGIHNKRYGATIGDVMDWFKTMTINEYIHGVKQYGWQRFVGKLWQRNYYDHIIRNDKSYKTISGYIKNNPQKWSDDRFYD